MTDKEYRSHQAISRSELWKIRESPEKFKWYKENPPEATPALLFGQLFHKLALEPETVWDEFAVVPAVDRRTNAGRTEYAAFLEGSVGKTLVSADMATLANDMCISLRKNEYCRKLLSGKKEVPFFWTDADTGEECKCRADVIVDLGGIPLVVDLKSTSNASTDAFIKDSSKYGYDFQAAMYLEGVKQSTGVEHGFVFIAIEKDPPFSINILQADTKFVEHGYDTFRELLGIYHECKTTGNWFGYMGAFDSVNVLSLPPWMKGE